MATWMKDTLRTGAVASAATTAAATALGKLENDSAVGPINAVSHILWGKEATRTNQLDARHTLVGAALNTMAVTGRAGMHETLMPRGKVTVERALMVGAAKATLTYVTDYHVVPERFTPGFKERFSRTALFGVYAALAVSLAMGSLLRSK